jgi:sec-independent protein translocase protein TatC
VAETPKEMGFLDHLEELRWHLIRSAAAVAVFMVLAFYFMPELFFYVLLAPSRNDFWIFEAIRDAGISLTIKPLQLQSRTLTGQFTMHLLTAVVAGLIAAFPYIIFEIWRFIRPALKPKERAYAVRAVFFVSLLFFCGVAFGYFLVSPITVYVLYNYEIDTIGHSIQTIPDVTDYIGNLCWIVISTGLIFQLPIIAYVMTRLGLLSPAFMRKFRRHAILVNLVLSSILSPGQDIFSMLLLAIPMIGLYEISIWVAALAEKQKVKSAL